MKPKYTAPGISVASNAILLATLAAVLMDGCSPVWASEVASATAEAPLDFLSYVPDEVKFTITTLGFGGIAGWCVGFTLKKVAKLLALVFGIVAIGVQLLAYLSYITIHWEELENGISDDVMMPARIRLVSILTYNLPFASTFTLGLYIGFRRG